MINGLLGPNEIGWLTRTAADVPGGDGWLSGAEQEVQSKLRFAPRRSSWRLGRWTAKQAVLRTLTSDHAPDRVSIIAAQDGAPEPYLDGHPLDLSLSISHRQDRAIAGLALHPMTIGCDLERIEAREDSFLTTYFTAAEIAAIRAAPNPDLLTTLGWSAKESVLKLRRTGLRRDTRSVEVALEGVEADSGWQELRVQDLETPGAISLRWRRIEDEVQVIATSPSVTLRAL